MKCFFNLILSIGESKNTHADMECKDCTDDPLVESIAGSSTSSVISKLESGSSSNISRYCDSMAKTKNAHLQNFYFQELFLLQVCLYQ